jgi:hypothetical protein
VVMLSPCRLRLDPMPFRNAATIVTSPDTGPPAKELDMPALASGDAQDDPFTPGDRDDSNGTDQIQMRLLSARLSAVRSILALPTVPILPHYRVAWGSDGVVDRYDRTA